MSNSFWSNPIVHGVVTVILFVLPLVISANGSWQQLTIGGILVALYKALQNKSAGLTAMGVKQ